MKYEILDMLKNSTDYVSGEDIGEKFNVSRTAVWKYIAKLRDDGYEISSVSNKGYKLSKNSDVLNSREIDCENCICLDSVDSTNNEAKRRAADGAPDKLLVTAKTQLAGKGRLGRSWEDTAGKNVTMSLLLKPNITPEEAPQLTLTAGLAAAKAIKQVSGIDVKIKWPNDIVCDGKKLAGILTEMSASIECINYVVVGIGINVNSLSFSNEIADKASSLRLIAGKKFRRADVINTFVNVFLPMYDKFCKYGFSVFCDEYNRYCANIGCDVKVLRRDCTVEGKVICVDKTGRLLIEKHDGSIESIMSGEVSVRRADGKYI